MSWDPESSGDWDLDPTEEELYTIRGRAAQLRGVFMAPSASLQPLAGGEEDAGITEPTGATAAAAAATEELAAPAAKQNFARNRHVGATTSGMSARLARLRRDPAERVYVPRQALIICPSRELAMQSCEYAERLLPGQPPNYVAAISVRRCPVMCSRYSMVVR